MSGGPLDAPATTASEAAPARRLLDLWPA